MIEINYFNMIKILLSSQVNSSFEASVEHSFSSATGQNLSLDHIFSRIWKVKNKIHRDKTFSLKIGIHILNLLSFWARLLASATLSATINFCTATWCFSNRLLLWYSSRLRCLTDWILHFYIGIAWQNQENCETVWLYKWLKVFNLRLYTACQRWKLV